VLALIENAETVNDLVLSQEDKPQTHRTVHEISRETGIHRLSLTQVIWKDLHLKSLNVSRGAKAPNALSVTLTCAPYSHAVVIFRNISTALGTFAIR